MAVQNRISEEDNQKFLGQTVEVLVEGPSKRSDAQANPIDQQPPERPTVLNSSDADSVRTNSDEASFVESSFASGTPIQLTGRTHCDRIVVFDGTTRLVGQTIPIGIYDISAFTLMGTVITDHVASGLVNLAHGSTRKW